MKTSTYVLNVGFGVLILAVCAGLTQASVPSAPLPSGSTYANNGLLPRTAFFESRTLQSVRLSPNGQNVAYLRKMGETNSVWILPTQGGRARVLLGSTDAIQILWSQDSQWMFLRTPRELMALSADGKAGARVPLGSLIRRQLMRVDTSQPAAVLLREREITSTGTRWRVARMDVGGNRELVRESSNWIDDVAFNSRGKIAALTQFDGKQNELMRVQADGSMETALTLKPMENADVLLARADGALVLDTNAGGNFRRIAVLDASNTLTTLHQDPDKVSDLDEVVQDPKTGEAVAVSYRSTTATTIGLGDASARVSSITARFPDRDIALQVGNGAKAMWLVTERAATLRDARYHLYNPDSGTLKEILDEPALRAGAPDESQLVEKRAVSFTASDGRRIHGFILLPRNVDPKTAPLVIQVHGGPINYFRPGYDGIAQLLANRGYVVYQSNFRGSTGHGRDYTFASNGDYGNGRVQQDIVEGARWTLAQGYGDANRVGIVGHSFGGYSTLMGLTFQPDLFKAGFAGAPPADLGWNMRWELQHGYQAVQPGRSMKSVLEALQLDGTNATIYAKLHGQSPLQHSAAMKRPLLIFAGGADPTVPMRSVTRYVAQLRLQKAPVTFLVDPQGGHSPDAPLSMEAYSYALEHHLHTYLGGRELEPGGKLQAWLKQNLRAGALQ